MMFDNFQRSFSRDVDLSLDSGGNVHHSSIIGWSALIGRFGGASFDRGLYRVITGPDEGRWNGRIAAAFPEFANRVACFGFDWTGRVFAVDPQRLEGREPGVVMFEPGTGEALEIPCSIVSFHEQELIQNRDAALASDFHEQWLASGGSAPRFDQCVGYKNPLFLGGADEVDNLELSDIDVYWHLMGQLIVQTRGLPPGTPIKIRLD
jgi:hypothetical protein